MYIRLIRNKPQDSAITGRLVIDGRWFCNTLERVGYQIPALCYHIAVTQSPKFKRLLPLVCGVPQTVGDKAKGDKAMRQGIRIHRGSKPEHSTGCVLLVGDNNNNSNNINQQHSAGEQHTPAAGSSLSARCVLISHSFERSASPYVNNKIPVGSRSAADVEQSLTQLLLQTQEAHEEIILEVIDFRPGTDYGYDTPCPSSECACEKEIRSANFARRHSSSILEPTRLSDDF